MLILSVVLIMAAVVTIYYWFDFHFKGVVHVIMEDWYIKFERDYNR